MKQRSINIVTVLAVIVLLGMFFTAHALVPPVPPGPGPTTIDNPLAVGDIPSLITIVVDAVKNIGYFVIVLFIIYSGFLFVKARGDEKAVTDAKKVFLWTVVGAAVLLGAQILSTVIKGTVDQLGYAHDVPITHIEFI